MTPIPVRRVVIIGFMGAGKSTVGPRLAEAIGWDFIDLDDEIARREGAPVPDIIRRLGITGFRSLESAVGSDVLQRARTVIAMGGGWPVQPGHMDMLDPASVSIWLRVGAEAALERVAESETVRPLLQVDDPREAARTLLRDRMRHYRRGRFAIDTDDRSPAQVVNEIIELLTTLGEGIREAGDSGVARQGEDDREVSRARLPSGSVLRPYHGPSSARKRNASGHTR